MESKLKPSIPIEVGKRLLTGLDRKGARGDAIRDGIEEVLGDYTNLQSRFLNIDYKVDDKKRIQFHIFPRVPDHNRFYPNDQAFASAVEGAVARLIGRGADVEAEFHEKDGVGVRFSKDGEPYEVKEDTRVLAYCRKDDGTHTHIKYPHPVPMLWFSVGQVPGMLYPRDELARMLAEAIVAATEKLLPGA